MGWGEGDHSYSLTSSTLLIKFNIQALCLLREPPSCSWGHLYIAQLNAHALLPDLTRSNVHTEMHSHTCFVSTPSVVCTYKHMHVCMQCIHCSHLHSLHETNISPFIFTSFSWGFPLSPPVFRVSCLTLIFKKYRNFKAPSISTWKALTVDYQDLTLKHTNPR